VEARYGWEFILSTLQHLGEDNTMPQRERERERETAASPAPLLVTPSRTN
jgi:hypothetical protein